MLGVVYWVCELVYCRIVSSLVGGDLCVRLGRFVVRVDGLVVRWLVVSVWCRSLLHEGCRRYSKELLSSRRSSLYERFRCYSRELESNRRSSL